MTNCKYRVVKGDHYTFHEVLEDEDGIIRDWACEPAWPHGVSPRDLLTNLCHMVEACTKPVLEEVNGKLVEVKEGVHNNSPDPEMR